jgi:mRNA-degrading endonuclease RelE of RelBE toxin-antitoxin system
MEFIETGVFTKYVSEYLSEDEYAGFQSYVLQNPESGKIIQGSGGIRKVRWATTGKGKSGGVRIIYYYKKSDFEIWLLTIYSKREVSSIPTQFLRRIAKEIEND